jgi:hypothetical protein
MMIASLSSESIGGYQDAAVLESEPLQLFSLKRGFEANGFRTKGELLKTKDNDDLLAKNR